MDKVTFVEVDAAGVIQTHAIIENADGSFTSMPKSIYDAQQAAMNE